MIAELLYYLKNKKFFVYKNTFLITIFFIFFLFISKNSYAGIEEYEQILEETILEENIPTILHEDFKNFAYYYYIDRDVKKAIKYGENLLAKSINHYERTDDQILEIYIYLGELYFYEQDLKKGYEYLSYALPKTEELYPEMYYNIILANFTFGKICGMMGYQTKALNSFEKLITLLDKKIHKEDFEAIFQQDDPNIRVSILSSILASFSINYDIEKSSILIKEIEKIIEKNEISDFNLTIHYNNLGIFYNYQYKYFEALENLNRSLEILDSIVEFDVSFHPTLWSSIAMINTALGNFEVSKKMLLTAEEKTIEQLGNKASGLFAIYHNLGSNYSHQFLINEAIDYLNKAIEIGEYNSDLPDKKLLQTLLNIASMYIAAYKIEEAEKINEKILSYYNKENEYFFLEEYQRFLINLNITKGNLDKAKEITLKTLNHTINLHGNKNRSVVDLYATLANIAYQGENLEEAINYSEKVINFPQIDNSNSFFGMIAYEKMRLSEIYISLWNKTDLESTNFIKAKQYSIEAYDFYKNYQNLNSELYLRSLTNNAQINQYEGNYNISIALDKEALKIIEEKIGYKEKFIYNVVSSIENQKKYKGILSAILGRKIDFVIAEELKDNYGSNETFEEIFKLTQLINANKTDQSLKKMGIRASTSNIKLKNIIYKKDQKKLLINDLSKKINFYKSLNKGERNFDNEKKLKFELNNNINEQEKLNNYIYENYPEYVEISSNQIMKLDDIFNLLKDDEALLYFLSDYSATAIFLITNNDIQVSRIALTNKSIKEHIDIIRESFDISKIQSINNLIPFPIENSQILYKELLGNELFSKTLFYKKHLFIVPSGDFYSLPFATLVENIELTTDEKKDYKKLPWLINKFSLSTLPSIHSLKVLRTKKMISNNSLESFVGIGNPIFNSQENQIEKEITFNKIFSKGKLADVQLLNQFTELPETEKELKMLAANFADNKVQLFLRDKANESEVKSIDFQNIDVIAFSTHAIIKGEINSNEPGLILTPPNKASNENDGILTSSEILNLKIDAKLVILSACNTASSQDFNSEPLTGLARAFFFAGAKSLLVSNWAVESESAVKITTNMFDNIKNGINKSESLRLSIINTMKDSDNKYYSHPLFWAPFMLVGDR